MKLRKILRNGLALILVIALLSTTVMADTWYLDQGDISVHASDAGQTVTQGSTTKNDSNPIITQTVGATTSSTITVTSQDGQTALVTIWDIDVSNQTEDQSVIDIGDSDAEIRIKGENTITHGTEGYSEQATVHVGSGSAKFTGDGKLTVISDAGAKFGSHDDEDFTGRMHFTDQVTIVTGDDGYRATAAFGSGYGGNYAGTIVIDGHADITAVSNDEGAGIGTGDNAEFTQEGQVIIGGDATVYARGTDDSSGIGGSETGAVDGLILIKDRAKVTAVSEDEAAAIGSGEYEDLGSNAKILIMDDAVVGAYSGSDNDTASIGAGGCEGEEEGCMFGTIAILGRAKVTLGISKEDTGKIRDGRENFMGGAGGSSEGRFIISEGATINGVSGSDLDALKDYVSFDIDPATGEIANLAIVSPDWPYDQEAPASHYWVTDLDGSRIPFVGVEENGILTVTTNQADAILVGNLSWLAGSGLSRITFRSGGNETSFPVSPLVEQGGSAARFYLTHENQAATLRADSLVLEGILP